MDRSTWVDTVDAFIDEQRARCLWWMRADWAATDDDERLRALRAIRRHGDRVAFARAAELERWLSQTCSETSADS